MTVTTRRERRERERRKQRREGRPKPSGRRNYTGILVTLGVLAIVVIGGFILLQRADVFSPRLSIDPNRPEFQGPTGAQLAVEGTTHITQGQPITYQTKPPASGSHWPTPASWGIKDQKLPDETTVHNLEHGGVVVAYNGLSDDEVSQLKALMRSLEPHGFRKYILEPYPDLPASDKIVLSAWTWQLRLPGYDLTEIVKFFNAHYQPQEAPERLVP